MEDLGDKIAKGLAKLLHAAEIKRRRFTLKFEAAALELEDPDNAAQYQAVQKTLEDGN